MMVEKMGNLMVLKSAEKTADLKAMRLGLILVAK